MTRQRKIVNTVALAVLVSGLAVTAVLVQPSLRRSSILGLLDLMRTGDAAAAQQLSQYTEPDDIEIIIKALEEPSRKEQAIETLASMGGRVTKQLAASLTMAGSMRIAGEEVAAARVREGACEALERIGADAVDDLCSVLEGEEATARAYAARTLGRMGDKRAVPGLSKALLDVDPHVRSAAIESLTAFKDRSTVSALAKALVEGNLDIRSRVLELLDAFRDPTAEAALTKIASETGAPGRGAAARALYRLQTKAAVGMIAGFADDKDREVKTYAIFARAQKGDAAAMAELRKLLEDEALSAAEFGLVKEFLPKVLAGKSYREPLVRVGQYDPYSEYAIRDQSPDFEKEFRGPEIVPGLYSKDDNERRVAIMRLAGLGGADAYDWLKNNLNYPMTNDTPWMLAALGSVGEPEAFAILVGALTNRDELERWGACAGLANLGNPGAAKLVKGLLGDSSPKVRRAAAATMGATGDGTVEGPLVALLGDKDVLMRETVTLALSKCGADEAVRALAEAAGRNDGRAKDGALFALLSIGTPEAVSAVATLAAGVDRDQAAAKYRELVISGGRQNEQALTLALSGHGTLVMAQDLYWCGNERLRLRAQWWALRAGKLSDLVGSQDLPARPKWSAGAEIQRRLSDLGNQRADARTEAAVWLGMRLSRFAPPRGRSIAEGRDAKIAEEMENALGPAQGALGLVTWDESEADAVERPARWGIAGANEMVAICQALRRAVNDYDPAVRIECLRALASLCDPMIADELETMRSDADDKVAVAAFRGLISIENDKIVWKVVRALDSVNPDIRAGAADWLGVYGGRRGVDKLMAALADETSLVRIKAAMSLGRIGDARSAGALAKCLGSKDASVMMAAALALERVDTPGLARAVDKAAGGVDLKGVASDFAGRIAGAKESDERLLALSLVKLNDPALAAAMARCDNERLQQAALMWAAKRNVTLPDEESAPAATAPK